MNTPAYSRAICLWLSMLVACTSARAPAEVAQPAAETPPPPAAAPTRTTMRSDTLSPAVQMTTWRAAHTATLLADGRVLVAGGFRAEGGSEIAIASAEVYDPLTNVFLPTGDMNEARSGHTATLLPDGTVLIVGGWGPSSRTSTAELYDPRSGEFSYAASMSAPRSSMTATLLKNGQVLIAGGEIARNTPQLVAEIYSPERGTFAPAGGLNSGRSAHTATLLQDGHVLLIGGRPGAGQVLASAEVYDPLTGEFAYTGSLSLARYKHSAVLLADGDVLVVGGSNQDDWQGQYSSAEIYNTKRGTFARIADLNEQRFKLAHAAVRLDNGNVLIAGGNRQIEVFDAPSRRFLLGDRLDKAYYFAALTLLQDGRVLMTGGYDPSVQPSDKAWVYHPR